MNKNLTRLVGFLGIGLMGGTVLLPSAQVFAAGSETGDESVAHDSYTPEALAAYQKAHDLVQVAKQSKKIDDIRKAYEAFILITPQMNSQNFAAYTSNDQMDQIFFEIKDLLYKTIPTANRNKEIVRFAKEWEATLIKNPNSLYVNHFDYLVMKNTIKDIDGQLQDLEKELNRYANGIPTPDGVIPLPTDDEMKKIVNDFFNQYGADDPDPSDITDKQEEDNLSNQYKQDNGDNAVGQTIRHEEIGGVWYEIIETVVNGKVVKTDKRAMTKEESYPFLVQQNPLYDPYNNVQSVSHVTQQQWDYYTTDQNTESKYTIHYTINKDNKTPYYYDTGIRVNKDKAATYEQYKDVLSILADKTGGYIVEDQGKILVVLEGKTIVVNDTKKYYSKQELESLFSKFKKVDIRIMETSIGKAGSLEEQIVSKQAKSVKVDGKKVKLETFPMVENERALLPLEEVVSALGGKVSKKGDTYTASKNGNNVVFHLKENSVYVNGKAISMNNPPVYKDNVLMVEVNELATAFGYSMTWDGETSTISFDKQ